MLKKEAKGAYIKLNIQAPCPTAQSQGVIVPDGQGSVILTAR
jgi:hypothetical protein